MLPGVRCFCGPEFLLDYIPYKLLLLIMFFGSMTLTVRFNFDSCLCSTGRSILELQICGSNLA